MSGELLVPGGLAMRVDELDLIGIRGDMLKEAAGSPGE